MSHQAPLFDFAGFELKFKDLAAPSRLEVNPTGPSAVYNIEIARRRDQVSVKAASSFECDLFVLGLGAPPLPHITKIGGVPFRPYDAPWPTVCRSRCDRGKVKVFDQPLSYLAQFYFGDSIDLVDHTPSDVMLVFSADDQIDNNNLFYEWWSLTDVNAFMPNPAWPESPYLECFGYRYRTRDYLGQDELRGEYGWRLDKMRVFGGLKIGGIAPMPDADAGTFLCALGSVYPDVSNPYPWANVKSWTELDIKKQKPAFTAYDDATLQFYIDRNGSVGCSPCIG